jgi:tripartite-type tricarboxylate transporter receptor subunit TctC
VKKRIIGIALIAIFLTLSTSIAGAASYPDRPIKMLFGWPPGGDIPLRALNTAASQILKQNITIDYMPGASSTKAMAVLTNTAPDGYVIGNATTNTLTERPLVMEVQYDPIKGFTPVMLFGWYTYGFFVKADAPWKTFKEFVDYAKANPGKIKYANSGAKSTTHMVAERLQMVVPGLKMVAVPFDGAVKAITALLGGNVDCCFTLAEAKPFVDSGQLRMLASLSRMRWPSFPNVPTMIEAGYNAAAEGGMSIIAPPNLPAEITTKLQDAFRDGMKDRDFIEAMKKFELIPSYLSSQELGKFFKTKYDENAQMVKALSSN